MSRPSSSSALAVTETIGGQSCQEFDRAAQPRQRCRVSRNLSGQNRRPITPLGQPAWSRSGDQGSDGARAGRPVRYEIRPCGRCWSAWSQPRWLATCTLASFTGPDLRRPREATGRRYLRRPRLVGHPVPDDLMTVLPRVEACPSSRASAWAGQPIFSHGFWPNTTPKPWSVIADHEIRAPDRENRAAHVGGTHCPCGWFSVRVKLTTSSCTA